MSCRCTAAASWPSPSSSTISSTSTACSTSPCTWARARSSSGIAPRRPRCGWSARRSPGRASSSPATYRAGPRGKAPTSCPANREHAAASQLAGDHRNRLAAEIGHVDGAGQRVDRHADGGGADRDGGGHDRSGPLPLKGVEPNENRLRLIRQGAVIHVRGPSSRADDGPRTWVPTVYGKVTVGVPVELLMRVALTVAELM